MRRVITKLSERLTGFSTPFFGLSWQPKENETKAAQKLVTLLEDHGVLYRPYEAEVPDHCIRSIVRLRQDMTVFLGDQDRDTVVSECARRIRTACRKFMNSTGADRSFQASDFGYTDVEIEKHRIFQTAGRGSEAFERSKSMREHAFDRGHWSSFIFLPALGELRAEVGIQLARLGAAYELEVEDELHSLLPLPIEEVQDA
ncbi:DUF6650 family protein [Roseovarius sp. 2305UL8-3]|uniref:DUF6650 family protein n=1 Tax=Roseovarius conchicola TaxID=3121636 RepID=UPI003526C501